MSHHAIGLVEFTSIAQGIAAADAMAKTANVEILIAKSICPGKYIVTVSYTHLDVYKRQGLHRGR